VGIGSKRLRQGISLLACGVVFGAVTGQATAQGPPTPQRPPAPARAPIRPDPAPAAQAPTVASTTVSAPVSSTPASRSSFSTAHSVSTVTREPTRTQATKKRTRTTPTPSAQDGTARALRSLASWAPGRKLFDTSATSPPSGTNFLLLFVGLALVLLTIGETTFLRRAARAPKGRRPAEERLPIRRVQLRR
jgi:hypothetical protein